MKIAVYSIAKNEEQFVKRWFDSAKGADYFLIADTGSTDRTVEIAESLGIHVYNITVDPWRFDDARNASLALLPADIDYCIPLDLDEVLTGNWREVLEREFEKGVTRPRCKFVWSWKPNGEPDVQYFGDKIHARTGYRWRHPVHEVVTPTGKPQIESFSYDMEVHHFPDPTKSRGHYFPLLKLSVEEDPRDDRNSYYYARELFFNQMYDEAIKEFERFLTMSTWDAERAAACRYMAKCTEDPDEKIKYLNMALNEAERRETFLDLAFVYYFRQQWQECLHYVKRLLDIHDRPMDYISESAAWDGTPYDIGAVAAYYSGETELALTWTEIALGYCPDDERLKANLNFMEQP